MNNKLIILGSVAIVALGATLIIGTDDHTVRILHDGNELDSFTVELATTDHERAWGLSNHTSLGENEGMLFVHETEANRTYFMRKMDFGIDIVFIDANCSITRIHEAPAPGPGQDGSEMLYPGYGKYVLEVPQGELAGRTSPGDQVHMDGSCGI